MEEWGNKRANEYFEANVPVGVIRPKEGDPVRVVEKFIRDKYEHRRFVAASIPPKSDSVPEAETTSSRNTEASKTTAARTARKTTAPTPAPAPTPVPAKAPEPDLLNLMDEPPAPPAAPAFTAPPAAPTAASTSFGPADFGSFTGATPTDGFTAFDSPVKAAPVVSPVPNLITIQQH